MTSNVSARIAIIAPSAPPLGAGGVAAAHYHLFRGISHRGIEARLFTFGDHTVDTGELGITRCGTSERLRRWILLALFFHLKLKGSRRQAYQVADIWCSAPGAIRLDHHVKRFHPDVVILPDHGAPGLFVRKRAARMFMIAHHNPTRFGDNPLLGDFCPLDVRLAASLEQKVLGKIDGVICPSAYMKETFHATYDYGGPVAVIPNVLDRSLIDDVAAADLHARLGLPAESPVVYIPSAGSRLKGARFVYEIVRRLAAAYNGEIGFYLSGGIDAELTEELRLAPRNARIFMPGQVGYAENLAFVKGCSFGVSPTLVENFSMALLEAAFCGVPMVAFATGGNGEVIVAGESGFLVPYLDVEALLAHAVDLFDSSFCTEVHEKTVRAVRSRFDRERIIDDVLRFVGLGAAQVVGGR